MEELAAQVESLETRLAALTENLRALEETGALRLALRILEQLPESVLPENCALTVERPARDVADFLCVP